MFFLTNSVLLSANKEVGDGGWESERSTMMIQCLGSFFQTFAVPLLDLDKIDASLTYKAVEKQQLELCHPFSINLMRTRETLLKVWCNDLIFLTCIYILF